MRKKLLSNKFKTGVLFLVLIHICGCAPALRQLIDKDRLLHIPSIVAYLEPVLKENKVFIVGKLVLENPISSEISLDKIHLTIKDHSGEVLSELNLDWQNNGSKSNLTIEAPIKLELNIGVLNRPEIQIFVSTAITHKQLDLRIPIESKVAVLQLTALKNSLSGSIDVTINSKINSDILGNLEVEYNAEITNPFEVDLMLEEGLLNIYVKEGQSIATSHIKPTLLKAKEPTKISGNFTLQNTIGQLIIREFIKKFSIKTELTGKLLLSETQISIPFKINSIQQIDFSLFSKRDVGSSKTLIERISQILANLKLKIK